MDLSCQQIIPYNPSWVDSYNSEAEKLKQVFDNFLVGIEHIGSTSILGLASKPIIDIAVVIEKHEDADKFIEPLEKLGYMYDKSASSSERHFFRKGIPAEYHLSICYQSRGGFLKRQLLFRDYLRNHPEDRERYEKLKKHLIQEYSSDTDSYINGKSEFILEIIKKGISCNKKSEQ